MPSTRSLFLQDILTPEPDWETIAVYSDYLEDTNNLDEANALRWLLKWDHWPRHFMGTYSWWVAHSYEQSHMWVSRYGKCGWGEVPPRLIDPEGEVIRATLPPEYKDKLAWVDKVKGHVGHDTLQAALEAFFTAYSLVGDITPILYQKKNNNQ